MYVILADFYCWSFLIRSHSPIAFFSGCKTLQLEAPALEQPLETASTILSLRILRPVSSSKKQSHKIVGKQSKPQPNSSFLASKKRLVAEEIHWSWKRMSTATASTASASNPNAGNKMASGPKVTSSNAYGSKSSSTESNSGEVERLFQRCLTSPKSPQNPSFPGTTSNVQTDQSNSSAAGSSGAVTAKKKTKKKKAASSTGNGAIKTKKVK